VEAVGEPHAVPVLAATWIALAWLVSSTILAFVLIVWVLGRWSASGASYGSVLSPFVTFVLGSALVGEAVTPLFLIGSGLVLLGVYLGGSPASPRPRRPRRARGTLPAPRTAAARPRRNRSTRSAQGGSRTLYVRSDLEVNRGEVGWPLWGLEVV